MAALTIHYDNAAQFAAPHLRLQVAGAPAAQIVAPTGGDDFGPVFRFEPLRIDFSFAFADGPGGSGRSEHAGLTRRMRAVTAADGVAVVSEVWCTGVNAFVYPVSPRAPSPTSAPAFLHTLAYKPGMYIPGTGGFSGLGANVLADGRVLFGLYHPNAARVFLMGTFNDWQRPGHDAPDPTRFIELDRHRGWFGEPNTWLAVTDRAQPGDEYKFLVQGGVPADHKGRLQQYVTDPYARRLGPDTGHNNSMIEEPTAFAWRDAAWRTPDMGQLVLYELSVYGFTEGDVDVAVKRRGKFRGITERIRERYFEQLGVNALSLMPLAEVPSPQGPQSLGYDPSLYFAVERDFGSPNDLRELVDTAHRHGLAVLLDQVFNHTSNDFNPLWKLILEHPAEEGDPGEGGLYFNGTTRWGNRVATEKTDVQNMLIDACKLLVREYHVDGFRFDATHTDYMDHWFLHRLAVELNGFKPDGLLIAENLPNQSDLNREGWDGFAQWSDPFHDKAKALLREGSFGDVPPSADGMADCLYFSKSRFAAHTNNAVNYSESHDETSIPFEVGTNPVLDHPAAKDRKGRLGLMTALVALGQPMLYMGQEFNVERDRNVVSFRWPSAPESNGFYQWVRRVIALRRRYAGLRLTGFDPATDGRFAWILGPWMDAEHGGGHRIWGWRARPSQFAHDALVIMLNYEGYAVPVDVELGLAGTWVKLADIDRANDIPPDGTNSADDPTALLSQDGRYTGFVLPSSSAFIYKWERGP